MLTHASLPIQYKLALWYTMDEPGLCRTSIRTCIYAWRSGSYYTDCTSHPWRTLHDISTILLTALANWAMAHMPKLVPQRI